MTGFVLRTLICALGLWLASGLVPSMHFDSDWVLLGAAVLLGVVNAVVRPVLVVLTLPITILTLGLFLWVVNAAMLGLVAWLLAGFSLGGFGSALMGSLIVSITGWVGSWWIGPRGRLEVMVIQGGGAAEPRVEKVVHGIRED
jgi:putative membrane protein